MLNASAVIMEATICEDCEGFLHCNHDDKWGRFLNSPKHERSVGKVLGAANSGCRICQAVVNKFRSFQPDPLPLAEANDQPVTFRLAILHYGNTNMTSPEDLERAFLQVFILQSEVAFRLWRITDKPKVKGSSCDDSDTGSDTSFKRAAEWLRECMLDHDNCVQVNTPSDWAPHRLLDVGLRFSFPDTIKLEHTKGWKKPVRYAALSHCWGDVQPLKLLQSNLRTFVGGIPLDDLPKTFQDAILTTRRLGIQYLWIDSLCIIQDSKKDWDLESSLMTNVYGGSMLNIAAAASIDCTGGLFQNPLPSYLGPCLISVESQDQTSTSWYQLCDPNLWHVEFETANLNTRAWVVQERLLSPRTLAFTKAQLFWECRCKRACDEFPSGYPMEYFDTAPMTFKLPSLHSRLKTHVLVGQKDSRLGNSPTTLLSLAWYKLVMHYSRQRISFEEDKLVAISGLAFLFAQQLGSDYFAGLWKSTLLSDLLWETNIYKDGGCRSLAYRAPSWSWASVECPVYFTLGAINSTRVTVVDVNIQTKTENNQWGMVTGGYLRLQGKLFPSLNVVFDTTQFSLEKRGLKDTLSIARCMPDDRGSVADTQLELLCLPLVSLKNTEHARGHICEFRGLVLLPEKGQPRGYYKRWGTFEVNRSTFFEDSNNQAGREWYVDGEEDMIVVI